MLMSHNYQYAVAKKGVIIWYPGFNPPAMACS